jgi:uncharacterized protein (DUF2384 family)
MSKDDQLSPDAFSALRERFQQQSRTAQAYYTAMHAARALCGSDAAADAWMHAPLAAFDGQTPAQLIGAGREDAVLAHLRALGA